MKRTLSLKYRIASIIILLAGLMIVAVLWLSLSLSVSSRHRELAVKEDAYLMLLKDACHAALIKEEYMDLQPYIAGLRQDPQVEHIILADRNNLVLVSTDPSEVGRPMPALDREVDHVWRSQEITNPTGRLGLLAMRFSETALKTAYYRTLIFSILIAIGGLTVMAFVGLWLGTLLTKRLEVLAGAARQMAEGDLSVALAADGADEVAELNRLFNTMAGRLETTIKDLKDGAEYIHALMNKALDAIVTIDEQGAVELANPAAEKIFGYSSDELFGMNIFKLLPGLPTEQGESSALHSLSAIGSTSDVTAQRKDGTRFPAELSASEMCLRNKCVTIAIIRDTTDRKQAEEEKQKLQSQLLHAHKMEAVGQLAGGIAHDFNNILTAIIGYGSIILMKMGADDPLRSHMDQVLKAAQRAANLTKGLLTFSRKQVINPQPVQLNTVIEQVEKLLLRLIGEDIALKTVLTNKTTLVLADTGQLEQVLINLATNARDAMPNGGDLTIVTDHADIDERFIRTHSFGKKGSYVTVSVMDTGFGMDESTRQKIFDPFFTTKEVGKGTGLGLAIIYGIIKQHNGFIRVSSELGKGTTFTIYLSLIKTTARSAAPSELAAQYMGGTETILLVEDDVTLKNLSKKILEESGYTVIEAEDGQDAIDKFRTHWNRIDLLLTDIIMPKKNGREVYEEAKRIAPRIKTLFISGYPSEIIRNKGLLEDGLIFVCKPFTPQELLQTVRTVLDK
ncbi:MAG: PAS domain S-box protein [Nitrospirae bacterium]|nr:PAS domain S-box protein [Nitrospirota bacterium]